MHRREAAANRSGNPSLLDICLFFKDRLFELAAASVLIGMSFHLVVWPSSVESSSLRDLARFIDPSFLSIFFGVFGATRLAALCANGMWPYYGPWIRALGALAGALVFGNMGAALYQGSVFNNVPPSLGLPVYTVLVLFELLSMYIALVSAGTHHARVRD